MVRKSRIYPDLTAMRLNESFVVNSAARRNNIWPTAKKLGIQLVSYKLPNGHFRITKISGPVNYEVPSPIIDAHATDADSLHFELAQIKEVHKDLKRSGLQELAAILKDVEPCPLMEYMDFPTHVHTTIQQIILHKNPASVAYWLREFFDEEAIAPILKQALIHVAETRLATPITKIEKAIEVLKPKWDNGIVVITHAPRYISTDVVDHICNAFEVDRLFIEMRSS